MYNHFNHCRFRKHIIQMWVSMYIIHKVLLRRVSAGSIKSKIEFAINNTSHLRNKYSIYNCTAKPRDAVFSRHSLSHIESTVSTNLSPSMILGVLK